MFFDYMLCSYHFKLVYNGLTTNEEYKDLYEDYQKSPFNRNSYWTNLSRLICRRQGKNLFDPDLLYKPIPTSFEMKPITLNINTSPQNADPRLAALPPSDYTKNAEKAISSPPSSLADQKKEAPPPENKIEQKPADLNEIHLEVEHENEKKK